MARSLFARLHQRHAPTRADGVTRREMLLSALAATAGLMLSERGWAQPSSRGRVVVIGAGFSGLAAAFELKAAGYDVQVVEARNRVGGRVLSFSDFVPGKVVEGGAELVGSNHLTWMAYARQFGLEFLDVTEEDAEAPVVLEGRRLSAAESAALWEEMDAALDTMTVDAATIPDADRPWTAPNAPALDLWTVGDWLAGLKVSDTCRAAIDAMLTADNGVHTSWQSYLAHLAMVKGGGGGKFWTDSEVYRCRGGNQQLAERLADGIGRDRIALRTAATHVTTRGERVEVRLRDGAALEADEVVLAVPPTTWNRIAFSPQLPAALTPQMGSNVKFLMRVRSRFWTRAGLASGMLSSGPVQLTWHQTDNQPGVGTALVAFSGGPNAEECRSWGAAERVQRYMDALSPVYRGLPAALMRHRFMDWPGDAWAKGSYSFPAPGQITTFGETLINGLGRVHFAGEHCAYAFSGYMEGALHAGVRVARSISAGSHLASTGFHRSDPSPRAPDPARSGAGAW